jgi:antitoxin component YwqK of YwqJK toxin-antitoxin module
LIFAGDFKDHQRNGEGKEYHPDGIKAKEGIWEDGKLVDGFIYNVLLVDNKTLFNDEINFLVDSRDLLSFDKDDELLVGCLKIEAGEKIIAQETIKDAAEVWDEYYDDKLA